MAATAIIIKIIHSKTISRTMSIMWQDSFGGIIVHEVYKALVYYLNFGNIEHLKIQTNFCIA